MHCSVHLDCSILLFYPLFPPRCFLKQKHFSYHRSHSRHYRQYSRQNVSVPSGDAHFFLKAVVKTSPFFFSKRVFPLYQRFTKTFTVFFASGRTGAPTRIIASPNVWDFVLHVLRCAILIACPAYCLPPCALRGQGVLFLLPQFR